MDGCRPTCVVVVPLVVSSVHISREGPTSLKVQWDELPQDQVTGIVLGYRLFYRRHGTARPRVVELHIHEREHVIEGMSFHQLSNLRIRAARWREGVYVLQMFLSFFCFFPSATIVHKYETTVLGNG